MRTEAQRSYRQGFVLTEEELRRVVALAVDQVKKATGTEPTRHHFILNFRNGAIAGTESIDEVVGQENMGTASISQLELSVGSGPANQDWNIDLSFIDADREEGPSSTSVRYKIVGNERDWVFVTSSLIEERIRRIRRFAPNQLLLGRPSGLGRLLVLVAPLVVIFGALLVGVRKDKQAQLAVVDSLAAASASGQAVRPIDALLAIERVRVTSASRSAYSSMYPLVVLVAVGLTVALILVLWTAFFPLYNFVWGDYEQHFKRRQAIGRFVLGVVLLGVVIGIVANFLSRRLGF